ncbi:RNA polymerase subunit sigma-70 [Parablautia muri]|uniref:RNA polymerase subunit sigma-70 n=1 Tax=Parablautia muri TaxID=2320879 RepID=A0A9X5GRT7_9FIRM|nr:RNA polymerase subunit sigma-70 [Parablautia muri]NBJ93533.1 RNA polymerase subunit sigma-70 [Parablautia muri]
MTEGQKTSITDMRGQGYGYVRIARTLGLSENTVKSFCRRKGLAGRADPEPYAAVPIMGGKRPCLCCGTEVVQTPGRKEKKFCSDKCRNKWWNSHLDRVNHKAVYEFICQHCKKPFTAYGNAGRKYCSHACYVADRFGGGADE